MNAIRILGPLLLLAAAQADAAVLTFSGDVCTGGTACNNNSYIDGSYGDVAGAVDVQYSNISSPGITSLRYWDAGYNDLTGILWADGGDSTSIAEIYLQPLNGQGITLHSFDLGAWPNAQRGSQFTILDGTSNTLLFSSGPITVGDATGTQHNHYALDIFSANGVRIQWGPSAYNVGIDNIDYSASAVPLPAAVWLMAPLLGGLGLVRRRAV